MIRVLIVEDQRMAREDMENYIQSSGRYCLAASITNAAMAETVCRQSKCELVLMDVCTENDESGLVAAEKIKRTMPQIKIIIVTSLVECSFIDRAMVWIIKQPQAKIDRLRKRLRAGKRK